MKERSVASAKKFESNTTSIRTCLRKEYYHVFTASFCSCIPSMLFVAMSELFKVTNSFGSLIKSLRIPTKFRHLYIHTTCLSFEFVVVADICIKDEFLDE